MWEIRFLQRNDFIHFLLASRSYLQPRQVIFLHFYISALSFTQSGKMSKLSAILKNGGKKSPMMTSSEIMNI